MKKQTLVMHALAMVAGVAVLSWLGGPAPEAGFLVVAHRGVPSQLPEHTFAGYDLAISAGVAWIEVDVTATRDSALIVSHDLTLWREAGVGRTIAALSLEEVQEITRLCGEGYYTLEEVFERYGAGVNYLLDIKHLTDPEGEIGQLLGLIAHFGLEGQVMVESFEWDYLQTVQQQNSDLPLVYLLSSSNGAPFEQIDRGAGAFGVALEYGRVSREAVERIHRQGGRVFVYFAKETPWKIRRCIALRVDGVISDYAPDVIARVQSDRNPFRWIFPGF